MPKNQGDPQHYGQGLKVLIADIKALFDQIPKEVVRVDERQVRVFRLPEDRKNEYWSYAESLQALTGLLRQFGPILNAKDGA